MTYEITCTNWRPHHSNTLRGFASFLVTPLGIEIRDVTVHRRDTQRWINLPGKPQIDREGRVVRDNGRIVYSPILVFSTRAQADEFRTKAIEALTAYIKATEPDLQHNHAGAA